MVTDHDRDDGLDTAEVVALRLGFQTAVGDMHASADLGERSARTARSVRKRRDRAVKIAGPVAVLVLVLGIGAAFRLGPFGEHTPAAVGADTGVTVCPPALPSPANPGESGDALLPARPGRMLSCVYRNVWVDGASVPSRVVTDSRRLAGADARRAASIVNGAPPLTRARKCPEGDYEALFFRNRAGLEAVVTINTCEGASDGLRVVDPLLGPGADWFR
ncbi:hypothetical protein ACPA54_32635 [Uniformispora flossi]|uniref:hypothetical protein n=1 Tax=Uniformispora flossi TaxID=3390723 RepID=UPI003C2D899B